MSDTNTMGRRSAVVHKHDAEGSITISILDGSIETAIEDRPDWAAGLVHANTGERALFYSRHLGDDAALVTLPKMLDFRDLSWSEVNEDHEVVETSANLEFRTECLRAAGFTGPVELLPVQSTIEGQVEIGLHKAAEQDEINAFNKAQDTKFEEAKRTGT